MFLYGYPQRSDSNPDSYPQTYLDDAILREHAQDLAEKRARKAKWLPDEVDNSDDEFDYAEPGLRERAYIDALRKKQVLEHLWRQKVRTMEEASRQCEQQEKKQQELGKRQREEERRRELQEEARAKEHERVSRARQQQWKQEKIRSKSGGLGLQSQPESSVPINFRRTPSPRSTTPARSPSETHAVPESKFSKPTYNEKHNSAASRIQQQYRIHKSHRILDNLASQFQKLKQDFVYPRVIDFKESGSDDGHVTVHANLDGGVDDESSIEVDGEAGRLAYTPVNYALHQYADAMEKLTMKLDGVDSLGDKGVREKRRSIVREISEESTNLERHCRRIWLNYVEKQKEEARKLELEKELGKGQAMNIDDEPVHVEHHEAKEDADEWINVDESASALEANGIPQRETTGHQNPLAEHVIPEFGVSQPTHKY